MKNRFVLLFFLPTVLFFAIVFWARGAILLDADFGWHLRMGEIIQNTGIPKNDPFSYTMPSYPFVDHEWLTDIVISKLYPLIGMKGLAVIFSLIATLAALIQLPFPIKKWSFVPFVLAAGSFLVFVGVRVQVISWLFFSILLFILFHKKAQKWQFLLPLFFILWANLHGGFGIGLAVLLVVTLVHVWEQRRLLLGEIAILALCIASTFINPYGIGLWKELWVSISDASLRWSILEWMPALFLFNFTFWMFTLISVLVVLRYRNKYSLSQLVLFCILLIAGLSSMRHLPFFLILALPMTINGFVWFEQEAKNYKNGVERLNKVYSIFAAVVTIVVIVEVALGLYSARILQERSFYPNKAVEFLSANQSCGQLFSVYVWGGYLIWKLPEKKVFIDGRMPSWRREVSPLSESDYALEEHKKVLAGKIPLSMVITKYRVDTVVLPFEEKREITPLARSMQNVLGKDVAGLLLGIKKDNYEGLIKELKDNSMVEIYKDNVAVVYRQKNSQNLCVET
ncbi:MAG: hypothetical protein ACD_50C00083G0015 [uncultured bacterium]|nr:MAG: hypothetical protein ACD_50C00083G0015 [uncultured bacterium]OGH13208.1 MAG: hypothetical protein A2687_00715 [Candidatus Levybacteria bacterium RIFCSPHIGHO2_01_FULL_38_26]